MSNIWLSTTNANRLRQSYLNGFLDISGNLTLRNGSATVFNDMNIQTFDKNNFDSSFGTVWKNYFNSNPYSWQGISISSTGQYQVVIPKGIDNDTTGNIYVSKNYGVQNSWIDTNQTTIQSNASKFQGISISADGKYITAVSNPLTSSSFGNNIYRSANSGETWTSNQTVLSSGDKMISVEISSTGKYQTIISETSGTIYGKIWTSNDYGNNWTNTNSIINGIRSLAISATGQYQIVSQKGASFQNTGGNIFYSNNYGNTWYDSLLQISNRPTYEFDMNKHIAISYDGKYQVILALAQSETTNQNSNIFISDNYGIPSSWKDSGVGAPIGTYLRSVAVSGSGKYQIVSTMNVNSSGVLLISKNFGKNWTSINSLPSYPALNYPFIQALSMSANGDYITGIIRVFNSSNAITAQGNIFTSSISSSNKTMFSLNYFGSDNNGNVLSNHPFNVSLPNFSNNGIYVGYDIIADGTYINSLNDYGSKNLLLQSQGGNIGIGKQTPMYTLDISGTCNTTFLNTSGVVISNNLNINSGISSNTVNSGALIVTGGVGISGNTNIGGNMNAGAIFTTGTSNVGREFINSGISSNSSVTGALIVTGGVGISGNTNIGGNMNSGAIFTTGTSNVGSQIVTSGTSSTSVNNGALVVSGGVGISGNTNISGNMNAGAIFTSGTSNVGSQIITSGRSSISTSTGALVITGGVGISGNINIGGTINATSITYTTSLVGSQIINGDFSSTSSSSGALIVSGGVGISGNTNIGGNMNASAIFTSGISNVGTQLINSDLSSTSVNNGALVVSGGVGISGTTNIGGNINAGAIFTSGTSNVGREFINGGLSSISTSTGALVVSGGVGISGNTNIGGNMNASAIFTSGTSNVGTQNITSGLSSTTSGTGALVVTGGVGISGNTNIGGNMNAGAIFTRGTSTVGTQIVNSGIPSNSIGSGALVVTGGVSISGTTNIGGAMNAGSIFTSGGISTNGSMIAASFFTSGTSNVGTQSVNSGIPSNSIGNGALVVTGGVSISGTTNIGGTMKAGAIFTSGTSDVGTQSVNSGINSFSTDTGALVVTGGVGVSGSTNIGGAMTVGTNMSVGGAMTVGTNITVGGAMNASSIFTSNGISTNGSMSVGGAMNAGSITSGISTIGTQFVNSGTSSTSTSTGALVVTGGVGISGTTNIGGTMKAGAIFTSGTSTVGTQFVNSGTSSNSIGSGALVVTGGVGISGNTNIAGNMNAAAIFTSGTSTVGTQNITSGISSSSSSTGALVVTGGVGISGNMNIGGIMNATTISTSGTSTVGTQIVNSGTNSSSSSTGALIVTGGVGVGGSINVGGSIYTTGIQIITNGATSNLSSNGALVVTGGVGIGGSINVGGGINVTGASVVGSQRITGGIDAYSSSTGTLVVTGGVGISGTTYIAGAIYIGGFIITGGSQTIGSNTPSLSSGTGALVVTGGVGIGGDINVGGSIIVGIDITVRGTMRTTTITTSGSSTVGTQIVNSGTISTSSSTGALVVTGGVGISGTTNIAGNMNAGAIFTSGTSNVGTQFVNSGKISTSISTGALTVTGGVGISGNTNIGGNMNAGAIFTSGTSTVGTQFVNSGTSSTSTSTGALVVTGGVGVSGNTNIGGNMNASAIFTSGISNVGTQFINSGTPSFSSGTGALVVTGGVGVSGSTNIGGNMNAGAIFTSGTSNVGTQFINSGTPSTSINTGALVVSGGVGVSGNINTTRILTNNISPISGNLIISGTININGNISAPTMVYTDNSTSIATTAYVTNAINNLGTGGSSGSSGGGGNMFNPFYFVNFTPRSTYTTDSSTGTSLNFCNSVSIGNNNFIYASVNNNNVFAGNYYRSIDYGNSWSYLQINGAPTSTTPIPSLTNGEKGLVTSSQNGKYVFVALNNRLKYSSDYGLTFNDVSYGSFGISAIPGISITGSFYQNNSTPCCSSDGRYVFTVAAQPTLPTNLILGSSVVYYANNYNFNTFFPSILNDNSGIWPKALLNLTCSYNGKTVFTIGGSSINSITNIYRSNDFGVTFNTIQTFRDISNIIPLRDSSNISCIKTNGDGTVVYFSSGGMSQFGGTDASGSIYRSIDGGNTFTLILSSSTLTTSGNGFNSVNCNGNGNMVVASSINNVIRFSYNYGVNWNSINIVNPWSTIGLSPVGDLIITGDYNVNSLFKLITFFPTSLNTGNVFISDTTTSISNTTGALVVSGGVGVSGSTNIGGRLNVNNDCSFNGNVIISTNFAKLRIVDNFNNRQPSIELIRGTNIFGSSAFTNWRIVASGGLTDGSMSIVPAGSLSFYRESTFTVPGYVGVGHAITLNDNGNVGIGTINPLYTLDVGGQVRANNLPSSYSCVNGGVNDAWVKVGVFTADQQGRICIIKLYANRGYNADITQSSLTTIFFKTSNGSSTYGTTGFAGDSYHYSQGGIPFANAYPNPIWIADISGTSSKNYTLYLCLGAFNSGTFYTAEVSQSSTCSWTPNYQFNSTPPSTTASSTCFISVAQFTINNNVGIGTNNPSYTLDVNGSIRSTSDIISNTFITASNNAGMAALNPGFSPAYTAPATPVYYSGYVSFNANGPSGVKRLGYIGNALRNDYILLYAQVDDSGTYNALGYRCNKDFIVDGKVGIGTTTLPNSGINFPNNGTGLTWGSSFSRIYDNSHLNIETDDNMYFKTNNTTRLFIDAAGNVGIGTTTPAFTLDVNGTMNSNILQVNTSSANTASIYTFNGTGYAAGYSSRIRLVPYLTAGGYYTLSQTGDSGLFWGEALAAGSGATGNFIIAPHLAQSDPSGGITMNNKGLVGIGLKNPVWLLTIAANNAGLICNSTAASGGLDGFQFKAPFCIYDSGYETYGIGLKMGIFRDVGSAYIQCEHANTGARSILLQPYAGNVGIGKTTADYKLDVAGEGKFDRVYASTGTGYSMLYEGDSTHTGYLALFMTNKTRRFYIGYADSVCRMSCENGTTGVELYGTFKCDSQITAASFNATSDYRLKSNIRPIMKTIDHLKPIEYDLSGGTHNMGFLAHEVQEEFPFLVSGEKDGKDMQSINYIGLIGLLVKEIQDLKSSVKTLQSKIEILESK